MRHVYSVGLLLASAQVALPGIAKATTPSPNPSPSQTLSPKPADVRTAPPALGSMAARPSLGAASLAATRAQLQALRTEPKIEPKPTPAPPPRIPAVISPTPRQVAEPTPAARENVRENQTAPPRTVEGLEKELAGHRAEI
jgi:hypothetical protein